MTLAALIVGALALGVSAVAIYFALLARGEAITARRELSTHRRSHAERLEERRAVKHGPPPGGPTTEQLQAVDLPTEEASAVAARPRLPRPGEVGR